MRHAKIRINNAFIFFSALLTVLISGTTVYSIDQFSSLRDYTIIFLFVILFLFMVAHQRNKNATSFSKKYIYIVLGSLIFFVGTLISHSSFSVDLFSKILMFALFCYMFNNIKNVYKFFKYLYDIVVILSIIALVFFIGLYILKIPIPYFTLRNGLYKCYYYLFFNTKGYSDSIGPIEYYRLQSIFWEPGVYGVYLILALFYFFFLDKEKDKRKLYIIVVSLLLTTSTTGIILGMFIIAVIQLQRIKRTSVRILTIVPLGIITAAAVYYVWISKKTGGGSATASYLLRMVDLRSSFNIWRDHLFFGTGYGNNKEFMNITSGWRRDGNSNGMMNWCMTMGLWGLLTQLCPFIYNIIKNRGKQRVIHSVFVVIYIGINMTEPLITTPLMIMLLSFEYMIMVKKVGKGYIDGIFRRKKGCINMS